MLALAGVTAMDVITGGGAAVTVSIVVPLIAPSVAVIVVDPAATAVASPAALMVAAAVEELAQVTEAVRFEVVPSLYVPVAVNCCVAPAAMDGEAGVIAMEERVGAAGVTESMAVPVTPLMVAVRVVVPAAAAAVARPAALTVATLVEELLQLAVEVTSPVEPSDQVPVAVNCWVAPGAMVATEGVTAMLASAGGVVDPLPEPLEPAWEPDPHPAAARAMRKEARASEATRVRGEGRGITGRYSKAAMPEFVEHETHHGVSVEHRGGAKMRKGCRSLVRSRKDLLRTCMRNQSEAS
jgi:hypothetical protein